MRRSDLDIVGTSFDEDDNATKTVSSGSDTTYQAGLVVDLDSDDRFSVFGVYSTSFFPNGGGLDREGRVIPPQSAEGIDVGLRFSLMENKLTGSLTYFDITRENIANRVQDPDTNEVFAVISGEEESTVFELEMYYNPTENWQWIASLGMQDPTIVNRPALPELEGFAGIDTYDGAASLFTSYLFTEGAAKGLRLGAGISWRDEGSLAESFATAFKRTESHTVGNITVSYDFEMFGTDSNVSLFVDNATDEFFYERQFTFGEMRRYRLSWRMNF
ncbi:MAG: hypothetical protein F6J89_33935 [Symploca sp. SIO1C4]|uniref:TonB-dependent receptor-like beta-barrel domain-containing protein n=1 Tax=Symploca sp. SIO1C4 TaxID=2607765 RepID=A0A6B3NL74_9CYAN|nr:hypothetical protein [Symploca sp. SIO1C4]